MHALPEQVKRGRGRPPAETNLTVLPPSHRWMFTHGQNVVLAALVATLPRGKPGVVARCDLMRRCGLSRSTVERALMLARQRGLTREWQLKPGEEANTIEIVSPEWLAWIEEHMPHPAQKCASLRK